MENEKLITILRTCIEDRPSEVWQRSLREKILREISRNRAEGAGRKPFWRTLGELRLFPVPALLLFLGILSGATVAAARQSFPGNPLYRVKLATEVFERFWAKTTEHETDYAVGRAEERLGELRQLAADKQTDDSALRSALIAETVNRYTEALKETRQTVSRLALHGGKKPPRQAAAKLERVLREYHVLLDSIDIETLPTELRERAEAAGAELSSQKLLSQPDEYSGSASSSPVDAADTEKEPLSATSATSPVVPASSAPAPLSP